MEATSTEAPVRLNQTQILKDDLRKILPDFLPEELHGRDNVRVLSVGCGWAPESTVITELLPHAVFLGIDINPVPLKGAKAINKAVSPENFQLLDATNPESFGSQPWDLIFLRNVQSGGTLESGYYTGMIDPTWQMIMLNCIDHLAETGYIYVASQSGEEVEKVEDFLKKAGLTSIIPVKSLGYLDLKSNFPYRENYAGLLRKA